MRNVCYWLAGGAKSALSRAGLLLIIVGGNSLAPNLLAAPASVAEIPVEHFARYPQIRSPRLSPQGNYLAAIKRVDSDGYDKDVLTIFEFPSMKVSAHLAFPGRSDVGRVSWANDERLIVTVSQYRPGQEQQANYGELFAMNADGSRRELIFGYRAGRQGTGRSTRQNNPFRGSHDVLNMLWDDPKHILISMSPWNNGREQTVRLAKLNVYDGRVQELSRAPALNAELYADADGIVRFSSSRDYANNTVLHRFDPANREWSIYQKAAFGEEYASPVALPAGGKTVFVQRAPDDGPLGVFEVDVASGRQTLIYRHDVADARLLIDREQNPWGVELEYGKHEFVPLDPEHPYTGLMLGLEQAFPAERVRVLGGTHDFRLTIVEISGGHLPEQYYLYNAETGALAKLFDSDPLLSSQALAQVTPIELEARDGLGLHGYLTLPAGSDGQNLPMVVMPHGGPFGINDTWHFARENQLLASRGYAVLQVNFRGSGGFGPGFQAAGIGQRGDAMQDDVTDATLWAIEEGHADADRICLYGWSHGGYAALRGVSREPELYQCAIGAAGVYDFGIQYRKADYTRYRSGRAYMRQSLGTDPVKLRAISPTHTAERIKAAVFLVHGDQDERVPVEHARAMRQALKAAGHPPRYLERRGEGHGFFKEENRAHFYGQLLEFLDLHIGEGVKTH